MSVNSPANNTSLKTIGTIGDYISIARPDHWIKHIFIVPGTIIAAVLAPTLPPSTIAYNIIVGLVSACLIASANYTINEWLDANEDRHHPQKHTRPAAMGKMSPVLVYAQYAALAVAGLLLASQVDRLFLLASVTFWISGICYNVRPLRTKDRVFFDVISEAINNPIRLVLGWSMVSSTTVPPLSLFGAFWMGGAFLMAAKRLSEYNFILVEKGPDGPGLYRRSFRYYSMESLTISCFFYAVMATFFVSVFLIKYREEYIISFPLIALLFGYYLHLGLKPSSVAQKPETLHKDPILVSIMILLLSLMAALSFINIPMLEQLLQSTFMEFSLG
ncbi:UbiA family prenyltransferase [Tardiphaga sp. 866_E4_N2_1]|uniref:UbiA family prenyltransferase n=1 Tax=unclassified Tardiphaga TaxID=2631404 RepID=UPI003F1FF806